MGRNPHNPTRAPQAPRPLATSLEQLNASRRPRAARSAPRHIGGRVVPEPPGRIVPRAARGASCRAGPRVPPMWRARRLRPGGGRAQSRPRSPAEEDARRGRRTRSRRRGRSAQAKARATERARVAAAGRTAGKGGSEESPGARRAARGRRLARESFGCVFSACLLRLRFADGRQLSGLNRTNSATGSPHAITR
jgi:hypothetical protein